MPRRGQLTRDEMRDIIKLAHEHCKKAIGVAIGKRRLTRARKDYLDCLKKFIQWEIYNRLVAKGIKVKPPAIEKPPAE